MNDITQCEHTAKKALTFFWPQDFDTGLKKGNFELEYSKGAESSTNAKW